MSSSTQTTKAPSGFGRICRTNEPCAICETGVQLRLASFMPAGSRFRGRVCRRRGSIVGLAAGRLSISSHHFLQDRNRYRRRPASTSTTPTADQTNIVELPVVVVILQHPNNMTIFQTLNYTIVLIFADCHSTWTPTRVRCFAKKIKNAPHANNV